MYCVVGTSRYNVEERSCPKGKGCWVSCPVRHWCNRSKSVRFSQYSMKESFFSKVFKNCVHFWPVGGIYRQKLQSRCPFRGGRGRDANETFFHIVVKRTVYKGGNDDA